MAAAGRSGGTLRCCKMLTSGPKTVFLYIPVYTIYAQSCNTPLYATLQGPFCRALNSRILGSGQPGMSYRRRRGMRGHE
jgi:hypothetical protein